MKHITALLLCGTLILVSAGDPNTEDINISANSNLPTGTATELNSKAIDVASKTANTQNVNENNKDDTTENLGIPEFTDKKQDKIHMINEDPQEKEPDNGRDIVSPSKPEAVSFPPEPVTTTTSSTTTNIPTTTPSSTTTTKPTTTPSSTTTTKPTTTPSSTTTTKPTTTTPSPTPTTTTKPTTTPSTTTTPTSTTTPGPKPIPTPTAGKWIVNGTNYTCIVVQMAAQINVTYMNVNHKKVFKVFNMPVTDVTSTGECGNTEQTMTLSWNPTKSNNNNTLTLHFVKDKSLKHYSLHHLEVSIAQDYLPEYNASAPLVLIHNVSQYNAGVSNSYRCLKQQSLLFNGTNSVNGTFTETGVLSISDLQFQAFKTDKSVVFGLAEDCAFDTPDYVPIGVGCALAILVIIVLIAYLVGRRRRQARGYLSM